MQNETGMAETGRAHMKDLTPAWQSLGLCSITKDCHCPDNNLKIFLWDGCIQKRTQSIAGFRKRLRDSACDRASPIWQSQTTFVGFEDLPCHPKGVVKLPGDGAGKGG